MYNWEALSIFSFTTTKIPPSTLRGRKDKPATDLGFLRVFTKAGQQSEYCRRQYEKYVSETSTRFLKRVRMFTIVAVRIEAGRDVKDGDIFPKRVKKSLGF
jgi:hypothetical protein